MTDSAVVPGQRRLFAVAPTDSARLEVLSADGRVLVRTSDLAAAVIAAASDAVGGWVVAPERWSARVTADGCVWQVTADSGAPVNAIHRVLALIPSKEDPT